MTAAAAIVLCTAPAAPPPGGRSAVVIAETLVQERLCACVNVVPGVTSFFRWEGRVDRQDEVLLVIKTTVAAVAGLQARLTALHPYELPELLVLDVERGLPAYLAWVAASVSAPAE